MTRRCLQKAGRSIINVPVSIVTRESFSDLKDAMGVQSQAEVVGRAVAIIKAITLVAR
jgi:hypothetical protein